MTRIGPTLAAAWLLPAVALAALAGPAAAQARLFEVEKSDATKLLQVQDDAGLVVKGAFGTGAIPATGAGVRLMWYPGKAAFRAGVVDAAQWDDGGVGLWSAAFGANTIASGTHAFAANADGTASGDRSVAMGGGTLASGDISTALGQATTASGFASSALGDHTVASGASSLAAGSGAVAAGLVSVALGTLVTAQGAGSFIFGDRNSGYNVPAGDNQFLVRAFGGIGFNTGVSIGCDLPAGSGTWACTSSRHAKEGFEDLDGEEVLQRLAAIRIQRWNYIGNPAPHVGPTAEDFREAFGLGESSTKIATVDADGIALRAIQALERRTAELRAENADLRRRLEALEAGRAPRTPTPTGRGMGGILY